MGSQNRMQRLRKPMLTIGQNLAWADEYHTRTGKWPTLQSGPIPGADPKNWRSVDAALRKGLRGLPGSSSLARLLEKHRGYRNKAQLPPLPAAIANG